MTHKKPSRLEEILIADACALQAQAANLYKHAQAMYDAWAELHQLSEHAKAIVTSMLLRANGDF